MRHIRALGAALILAVALAVVGHTPVAAEPNEAVGPAKPAAAALSAGAYATCVVGNDGSVRCWGANGGGQLGQGDTDHRGNQPDQLGDALPAISLGTGRTARAVTVGGSHACALLDNDTVKCWGFSTSGQLGQGTTSTRGSDPGQLGDGLGAIDLGVGRTALAVAAGSAHTCALLDNGTVKCWGQGFFGQLGYSGADATDDADLVTNRGDEAGEMGDDLPPVNLGAGRTATAITAGNGHTCALLDNGTVKCWGHGLYGQLGYSGADPDPEDDADLHLVADRGDNANEMGDNLPPINLGTGRTATAITAGTNHTCAVLDNGTVKCWGDNSYGQLGQGDIDNRGDNANEMGSNLPAVNLGAGRTARSVAAGEVHTCALLDNSTVTCWGNNQTGELGHGTADDTFGDQPTDMGSNLPVTNLGTGRTAVAVTAGTDHTCALRDNATVTCWGAGFFGQTGRGADSNIGSSPGDMGDNLTSVDLAATTGPSAARATLIATPTAVNVGDTITYTATIRNVGGSALTGLTVASSAAPNCSRTLPTLPIAATTTFTCTDIAAAGDVPTLTNQLTITNDQDVTLTPSAAVTVTAPVRRSVDLTLQATPAQIIVGDSITYVGRIANTGNVPLDAVTYTLVAAGSTGDRETVCAGVSRILAVGDVVGIRCEYKVENRKVIRVRGTLTVSATAMTTRTATDTVTVEPVISRADTLIRRGTGAFIGDNVYGKPKEHTLNDTLALRETQRYTWRVQNDGNTTDVFSMIGDKSDKRLSIDYQIDKSDVTREITKKKFTITLQPGESVDVKITVTATSLPASGQRTIVDVITDPKRGSKDSARIVVRRPGTDVESEDRITPAAR